MTYPARLADALADRYRIEREVGAGGMATVYVAHDLRHDRPVAIKVLKPELAAVIGADRFLVEIRTTAALQHPHILPLFDSGEADGYLYFVMPFVAGETIRDRLQREGPFGIDDALRVTTEVADALDYAHRQGVIHRDIKPDNILLRDGHALVMDFGIALALSAAADGRLTETGLSLGTPHYMSPEQAAADRTITGRSDIYSLASVCFEMLGGQPPHLGSSAQQILMKILTEDPPPVTAHRRSVPPHVAAALTKALQKLPADRFETARAFAEALGNPAFTVGATRSASDATRPSSARVKTRVVGTALLATAAIATIVLLAWVTTRSAPAIPHVSRHATTLGAPGLLDGITFALQTALAPDGSAIVFRSPLTGPGQLYVKRRDELIARPLAGTEGGTGPFFSPDGQWIGFVAAGELRRVPSTGGTPLRLTAPVDSSYNRGIWLDDGTIVFYDLATHSLRRLGAGDATSTLLVSPAMLGGRYPWLPSALPGARGILFTAHLTECVGPVACRPSRVYVYDAKRDTIRELFDDAIGAWYVPTGHVLYLTSAGTLMAAPWDEATLAPTGRSVAVLDGIQAPGFTVSANGTAFYLLGPSEFAPGPVPNASVVWVDRAGRVEPVDSTWQVNTGGTDNGSIGTDWGLSLSPDGRRIAVSLRTDLGIDVWIKPIPTGPASRLTMHPGEDRVPAWTPDGRSVTFLSDRPAAPTRERTTAGVFSVWQQAADGLSDPQLLWSGDRPTDAFLSADARWLLFGDRGTRAGTGSARVLGLRPGVDSVARSLAVTEADASGAALSPDGRWLAYVSSEQGAPEVFVRPFPDVSVGKWQVSSGGGSAPRWSRTGRELFYAANGLMHAVTVRPGPSFSAELPRVLFPIPDRVRAGALQGGTFDVAPDDRRFVMVRDNSWAEMAGTPSLVVVYGLLDEVRAKLRR